MDTVIQITSEEMSPVALKKELEVHRALSESAYVLQFQNAPSRYRGFDTTVLVALVGLAGTGLGGLITGLLNIAAQKRGSYLEISGKDWRIKAPVGLSDTELNKLVDLARSKSIDKIEII